MVKPAHFDYERPTTLGDALALLGTRGRVVKCMAGGQSLGPMLNLRLVQPDLLVDITRIPELTRIEEDDDGLLLGTCTTKEEREEGRGRGGKGIGGGGRGGGRQKRRRGERYRREG